jgi:hypothetical protein
MHPRRTLLTMLLLGTGLALAGCETFDLESIWNSKKPLPGERREVFPQGVPGVQQGVPPDLVRGYQPPAEAPPEAAAEPDKPKPRPRRVATPARPASAPARQQQQQPAPPQPSQSGSQEPTQSASQPTAAWPAPPARTASQPSQTPAWPDPPRPGTTTR